MTRSLETNVVVLGHTIGVKLKPEPKPRMTRADAWRKRDCVLRYWEYKDELKESLGDNYDLPAAFHLIFCLPMPQSWSKKKRERMRFMPHGNRPDVDNLQKGFLDALLEEDSMVYDCRTTKVWSDEPWIIIREIPQVRSGYVKSIIDNLEAA